MAYNHNGSRYGYNYYARNNYVPRTEDYYYSKLALIILRVMEEYDINPAYIPLEPKPYFPCDLYGSLRFFDTKALARFSCQYCNNCWASAHAWCYLDLKRLEICYIFRQQCKYCNRKAIPEFSVESVNRMATWAVCMHLRRRGIRAYNDYYPRAASFRAKGKPHDMSRCGKCQYLGRSCWR